MRLLLFVVVCSFISSCKHESLIVSQQNSSLNIITPEYVFTEDSVLITNDSANVSITPEIGEVNGLKYYITPSSLLKDSLKIKITVSNQTESSFKFITVLRKSGNDSAISFNKTIMPLMIGNCNFRACHGNGSKGGNVDLSTYALTMNYVVKYKPKQSLLYLSLIKSDPLRRMPPAGALHQYRISYFYKWIEQGANDN